MRIAYVIARIAKTAHSGWLIKEQNTTFKGRSRVAFKTFPPESVYPYHIGADFGLKSHLNVNATSKTILHQLGAENGQLLVRENRRTYEVIHII